MTWEVVFSEQIADWISELDLVTRTEVYSSIRLLEEFGPQLDRPYVGKIAGSKLRNMKELRPLSNSSAAVRVLFAFDPERKAILLVAGDKTGQWKKWYKKHIPLAEEIYSRYRESR
jgi:hypothetical protein